jgi:predicted nucleotidyltransferase
LVVRHQRPDIQERLCALARQYELVAIYAFGSRAIEIAARVSGEEAETALPSSDADIGVLPVRRRHLAARERVELMFELEDLLEVGGVDLVILSAASPYLALDAVRGELLCATDLDAEAEYQLYVLRRAGDLAPFERERWRIILAEEAI